MVMIQELTQVLNSLANKLVCPYIHTVEQAKFIQDQCHLNSVYDSKIQYPKCWDQWHTVTVLDLYLTSF